MLKVMIVDDEAIPRIALRSIVEKEYRVVGEAVNGKDALEMACRTLPDIVLVDIIMPDMDGLSFITQIAEQLPMTKYVVISNVEYVEYLRKAIRLKVFDYLIKGTLTEELLLTTLAELAKQILKERGISSGLQETAKQEFSEAALGEIMEDILQGREYCVSEVLQIFDVCNVSFHKEPYYCVFLRNVGINTTSVIQRAVLLGREIMRDCGNGILFKVSEHSIVCFIAMPLERDSKKAVRDFAYRFIMTWKNMFCTQFSAGISLPTEKIAGIQEAYCQAKTACEKSFYEGTFGIYYYDALNEKNSSGEDELKKMVKEALRGNTMDVFLNLPILLEELKCSILKMQNLSPKAVIGLYLDIVYYAVSVARKADIDGFDNSGEWLMDLTECSALGELHEGCRNIIEKALRCYTVRQDENSIVGQTKQYIAENLAENLSLENIAASVYLTPNYLGQLFKKETGKTLRDYITEIRIDRAKGYLLEGKSLHETAELTGFSTDSYFIQRFREVVHLTPKQFQKMKREQRTIQEEK